jgi:hypothetical protein
MLYRLLTLKHWQLFLLMFALPFGIQILLMGTVVATENPSLILTVFPLLMILYMALLFGWYYAMGVYLYPKLPDAAVMNLTRFKIFLLIPAVYILALALFMTTSFLGFSERQMPDPAWIGLLIPVHLLAMFCIFYSIWFVAKELKSVELQRPVTFSDFAGEFFLLWFWPIGVWILQPRINRLFGEDPGSAQIIDSKI